MEQRLDFEKTVEQFKELGTNAKTTLMFRLVKTLGPMALRSTIKYCHQNLDTLNKALPDGNPLKKRYLNYGKHKQSKPESNDWKDISHNESSE